MVEQVLGAERSHALQNEDRAMNRSRLKFDGVIDLHLFAHEK